MLTRKTVILAKIESSYGVDPTPTPAANALLVRNVEVKLVQEMVERDFYRSSLSQLPLAAVGNRVVELAFETELKGTGTRGQLPSWGWEGVLLRACGMSEAVSAGVSITYAPVSAGFESCTIYLYRDGLFHKITGCRGTFSVRGELGKPLSIKFEMKGLYNAVTDATPAAQTFSSVVPPALLSAGCTIGAYSPVFTKFEVTLNNELAQRLDANSASGLKEVIISGRKPSGSFDPEAVTETTKTFWADWASGTQQTFNVGPVGSVAGNMVELNCPKAQFKEVGYQDRNGILAYEIPMHLAMTNGDDEISIVIT